MKNLFLLSALLIAHLATSQTYNDQPFLQDYAVKYSLVDSLKNETLQEVQCDRNGLIQVLGSSGIFLPFEKELVQDQRYRPLMDMKILDVDVSNGQHFYVTDKEVFSNSAGGTFYFNHGMASPLQVSISDDQTVLVASQTQIKIFKNKQLYWEHSLNDPAVKQLHFDAEQNRFLLLTETAIYQVSLANPGFDKIFSGAAMQAMAFDGAQLVVGTNNGVLKLSGNPLKQKEVLTNLPHHQITALKNIKGELWYGSSKGAFKQRSDGKFDYYASKRWLVDDAVVDIAEGPDNSVLILTQKGLSQIEFKPMTLAEKAAYFQEIQRERHLRYA